MGAINFQVKYHLKLIQQGICSNVNTHFAWLDMKNNHYRQLTLHTESVGTVLRLEQETLAVLSSIFRGWAVALPPPPLGTLCPTG